MSTCEKENLDRKNLAKSKRPAQTLYVPKHKRTEEKKSLNTNACIQNSIPIPAVAAVTEHLDTNGSDGFVHSPIDDPSIIGYITDSSPKNKLQQEPTEEEPSILNKLASLSISTNTQQVETTSNSLNPNAGNLEPIPTTNSPKTSKAIKDSDDWFDLYDDLGQSLESKDGKPKSKQEQATAKVIDYSKLEVQAPDMDEEEYGHILELYDFPVEFKNENIFGALKEVIGHTDFDIKWVDDTHCLGVFASSSVASTVLSKNANPFLKTRPLSKATAESRRRAQRIFSYLKPYKPRPQTTSFVASRLIGASLGLNGLIPKDKLKEERKKIADARDSKRKDREIKDAVWNGK